MTELSLIVGAGPLTKQENIRKFFARNQKEPIQSEQNILNSDISATRLRVEKILKPRQTYLSFPTHFKRNNSTNAKKTTTFSIPNKNSDSLRLVFRNVETLPILHDSELENMLKSMKKLKVDVT